MWIALIDFALVMFSIFAVKSISIQTLGLMIWVGILLCLVQIFTSTAVAFVQRRLRIFVDGFAVSVGGLILFGLAMPAWAR